MNTDKKAVRVATLSPEEIEKMLTAEFGNKIVPVNKSRLVQQHQRRQRYQAKNASIAENQKVEDPSPQE